MKRNGGTVSPSSVLIFIEKKSHVKKKPRGLPLTHPGPTFSSSNKRVELKRFNQSRKGAKPHSTHLHSLTSHASLASLQSISSIPSLSSLPSLTSLSSLPSLPSLP
jgi:hypothetical protein